MVSSNFIKKLGPGILFAGAAIGVSHLVQSTRAGADFGWGLIWVILLANFLKYPFYEFAPRYTNVTNKSLLEGYRELGKKYLWFYFILSLASIFTIQIAVTIVTAALAYSITGIMPNLIYWCIVILILCGTILLFGKYKLLDSLVKWIVLFLTLATIISFSIAAFSYQETLSFEQIVPKESSFLFLIAFMGWMPAPLDITVWQSLWSKEKLKEKNYLNSPVKKRLKNSLFDFNLGYVICIILGILFMGLGALVMFETGESFSSKGAVFAQQLINLYTSNLGQGLYFFIAISAFTTMFSTTLTALDASPRAMSQTISLLSKKPKLGSSYGLWVLFLILGSLTIFIFFKTEMGSLIKLATILSFVTTPFFALLNYKLIYNKNFPKVYRPSTSIKLLSICGIAFLSLFSLIYLAVLFGFFS